MAEDYAAQLDTAARILAESSYTIALVGAGMSKESGIPTFRGGDGLWDKHGEPPMDGYQRFLADPAAWWADRVAERSTGSDWMQALDEAHPNPGHVAMAEMERLGYLKHIITQNIDDLHARPARPRSPRSTATAPRCAASNARPAGAARSSSRKTSRRSARTAAA
jgi:NAD-dependent SIR2 family protein deacetylase